MNALLTVLSPDVFIPWFLATVLGVFVGAVPGLTATMAVALIVPLTYHLKPITGLAMILGVSFSAIFAGDIPATFLRIPGTPASGAAVLDGFQMARKGKGALAITLDLTCSFIGGFIGVLILIFVSPFLAEFALKFTFFEYFWLGLLGLSMSAVISRGSTLKGIISMTLGLLVSTIGVDVTTGYPRFAFGNAELMAGVGFIPAMIGLFGLWEVLRSVLNPAAMKASAVTETIKLSFKSVGRIIYRAKRVILQSSIIGTLIGALPGAGADVAAWVAYGAAKRTSRRSAEYGSGCEEGVIAPTSANNAAIGGTWIPALVFGVPGDSITAIVLGAMLMYGLTPGPLVFKNDRVLVDEIFAVAVVSQFILLGVGYLGIKGFRFIFRASRNIILAGVMVFSAIGAFALNNDVFDIGVVLVFGIVGFLMEKVEMPLAPLILGLILGPMIEQNFRTGLIQSSGSLLPFVTRPISLVLFIILLVLFLAEPFKNGFVALFGGPAAKAEQGGGST